MHQIAADQLAKLPPNAPQAVRDAIAAEGAGPSTHSQACPRIRVAKVIDLLPAKYLEALEHNQLIAHCCRHPENHEIEAFYSSPADARKGVPDIYIFYCTCGRRHRRFCVGGSAGSGPNAPIEARPFWEVR